MDIAPVKRLPRPVTLAEIKADRRFKDFPLVRIARLSVMPVTDAQWTRIEAHGGERRLAARTALPLLAQEVLELLHQLVRVELSAR